MRDDYKALKEALKLESKQVLGTKEMVTTALVSLGQIAACFYPHRFTDGVAVLSIGATALALGGLYSLKSKFAVTRRKILMEHPTVYLYESSRGSRL